MKIYFSVLTLYCSGAKSFYFPYALPLEIPNYFFESLTGITLYPSHLFPNSYGTYSVSRER